MLNCWDRNKQPVYDQDEDEDEYEAADSWGYDDSEEESYITSNPADYYFAVEPNLTKDISSHATLVTICPKQLFDDFQELSGDWISTETNREGLTLGNALEEIDPGVFGFRGTLNDAEMMLVAKGLTKNVELLDQFF